MIDIISNNMTKEEQLGFNFGEPRRTNTDHSCDQPFQSFCKKHPRVWHIFHEEALNAAINGTITLSPEEIMAIVRRRTSIMVDSRYISLYAEMFVSNHQELTWIRRNHEND